MPQEQEENVEKTALVEPTRKRSKKKTAVVNEEAIMALHARPSPWPLGLALALIVLFIGVMSNTIVLILGLVLVAAAITGWCLERR
ncbi:MAG: cytochrome c oxidase subunit 4 [Ktedonobacteraceae bacterium]|nr:cytochrome c oxidase subunit 4 [Ktedonobacteraceae bacterium]